MTGSPRARASPRSATMPSAPVGSGRGRWASSGPWLSPARGRSAPQTTASGPGRSDGDRLPQQCLAHAFDAVSLAEVPVVLRAVEVVHGDAAGPDAAHQRLKPEFLLFIRWATGPAG